MGKSTLLKSLFRDESTLWIDLLLAETDLKYRSNPDLLNFEIQALIKAGRKPSRVIIDEIQKIPALLDVVHYLIEKDKIKFALTGSSARKLKRGGANLLAGRAFVYHLFPLSYIELANDFDLNHHLSFGGLPALYSSDFEDKKDKERFLKSYVHTYLKEEIMVEQLVRDLDPFHSFLEVSAQMNGEIVNFNKIAREAGSNDKSVERYYSILEDTLLGFHLKAFNKSVRKQQIGSSKFYYFDTGLVRALRNSLEVDLKQSTFEYGKLFESFIISEIFKLNEYYEKNFKLYFLKTKDGVELDLIIETPHKKYLCIEIKSGVVSDLGSFTSKRELSSDISSSKLIVLSQNKEPLMNDFVHVLPWREGLDMIFQG